MTIDLSSLGTAMYYSTAARKQQMDMDREQGQIVAEQQQNQLRQQQMKASIQGQKITDDYYTTKLPEASKMGRLGVLKAQQQEYQELVRAGDHDRAKDLKVDIDETRNTIKLEDAENKQNQANKIHEQGRIAASYLTDQTFENRQAVLQILREQGTPDEKLPISKEAIASAAKSIADKDSNTKDILAAKQKQEDHLENLEFNKTKLDGIREDRALTRAILARKQDLIEKGKSQPKVTAPERMAAAQMTTQMHHAGIDMQNLAQLTQGGKVITTTGAFDNITDHGIFGASSKAIGQSLTDQQKQMYRSIMIPLSRIAAITQSGGRYKVTDGAVKQEMDAYMAQPGHTHMTMLEKMGELKQAFIRDAESAIAAGTLNPEQLKYIEKSMDDINGAVPWNVSDVIEFYQKGGKAKDFGSWLEQQHPKDEGSWKDM